MRSRLWRATVWAALGILHQVAEPMRLPDTGRFWGVISEKPIYGPSATYGTAIKSPGESSILNAMSRTEVRI